MVKSERKRRVLLIAAAIVVGIIAAVVIVASKYDYIALGRGKAGMPRLLKQTEVRIDQLPELAQAMTRGSAPVRYAALIFSTPDRPSDEDALNIQMSIENGKVGFDWVLLAPRNIQDKEKFITFARAQGIEPVSRSENGVSYLRVEHTDIPRFTARVVTEMYHLPSDEPLGLVYEGFDWP
jgi:hypothetical protein